MARKFIQSVITANDLFEGDVVYFTTAGTWTREIKEAHVAHSSEQVETMQELAKKQAGEIVGAYAVNVEIDADGLPQPMHFREAFRTRGPSNYFHGKQADLRVSPTKMVA